MHRFFHWSSPQAPKRISPRPLRVSGAERLARVVALIFLTGSSLMAIIWGETACCDTPNGVWIERSFSDFSDGTFGNAGQNLYVSRRGVLQRIYRYDVNRDGFFDLVFCNAQNHWEKPPAYVYANPLKEPTRRVKLPSDGSRTGTMADLDGDGFADLVLGMWQNGIRKDLNAFVYFGSPRGLSERRHLQLPAPRCQSVAAGDFNGDGNPDIAFLLLKTLRHLLPTNGFGF